jgi:hypothetical protein
MMSLWMGSALLRRAGGPIVLCGAAVLLVGVEGLGCGSSDAPSTFNPQGDDDSGIVLLQDGGKGKGVTGLEGGLGGVDGSGGDDDGGPTDCAPGAGKFIYVVSDQNELYTFDPTLFPKANAFVDLGALHCPGEVTPPDPNNATEGVNSMAVDRQAIAWVNFADGKIFKVDTTQSSLPCTDTHYVSGQGNFTPQLGMGFATASKTDHTETLYVSDNTGPGGQGVTGGGLGLGTIDTQTMTMTVIGPWGSPVTGYNAELSGTGDGRLYGFFTTTPSDLGEIDKASGNLLGTPTVLSSVQNSNGGYAFSFWGGDFWFYTAYDPTGNANVTTTVTHYVSADAGSSTMPNIGFTIVGAGSSTCVPFIPPPPPK